MSSKHLTIGRLAKLANLNVETIRFYQKRGLIQEPPKPVQGYRIYSDDVLAQLVFIQRAKCVGFTLTEIKNLLTLGEQGNCDETKNIAQQKLTSVNDKLTDLTQLKKTLEAFIMDCENRNLIDECPIIQTFKKKTKSP
jgi:MerR family mercuric resistance operon transcriptional regulator